MLMTGCALWLTAAHLAAGEKIIFSGRDGQAISFDFTRQVRLLPPEMEESRIGRSRPNDPASFIPLVDPSLSPNSLRRRREAAESNPDRDWLFKNPDSARTRKKELNPGESENRKEESAMMKYMRGDENDARSEGSSADSENRSERLKRDENSTKRRQPLNFRKLAGLSDGHTSLLRRVEEEASFARPMEKQQALTEFFKANFSQEGELRARRSRIDFQQRILNPFNNPKAVFGIGPQSAEIPGIPTGLSIPSMGSLTDGALAPNPVNRAGILGAASVFESRSMPANFGVEAVIKNTKPKRIRRKPIDMSIRKRDF